jgi:hypothetical protein
MELRLVWLAITTLSALFIAALGGILSWLAGNSIPAAILMGGASFAGAVGLSTAIRSLAR